MTARTALALAGLVLAVGCGHSGSNGHTGRPVPVDDSPSIVGGLIAKGTIVGQFRIVGGPAPGINRPLNGTITVHDGSATGRVVATTTTHGGRFTVYAPAGRYVLVGTSSHVTGAGCTSGNPTTLETGQTEHVTVQCDVP